MIEVRALQSFVALAEELHFGRTADGLGIAQSVLSAQIRRIEDRIGTRLFERGRRSAVALTPAGRTFLAEARRAVDQVERAERVGRMAGRGEAGPVRIGFVLSAALNGCLADVLSAIRAGLPALEIQADPMDTPEQIAAIGDGRLDLALIRPRPALPDLIEARVVHGEEMGIVLAEHHPLAALAAIDPATLAEETFIVPQFSDGEGFGGTIDRLSRLGRFEPRPMLRTRDFVTAISMAAAGYGVVLAPRCMARLGVGGVAFRPLVDHPDEVGLMLAWRRGANPRLLATVLARFGQVA